MNTTVVFDDAKMFLIVTPLLSTITGKTNVAMLAVLNTLGQFRRGSNETDNNFDLQGFKIVYVVSTTQFLNLCSMNLFRH